MRFYATTQRQKILQFKCHLCVDAQIVVLFRCLYRALTHILYHGVSSCVEVTLKNSFNLI